MNHQQYIKSKTINLFIQFINVYERAFQKKINQFLLIKKLLNKYGVLDIDTCVIFG